MANALASVAYETIKIDKREILQSLLDIDDKKRSNLFAWNGQFSPQFIEAILDHYATHSSTVLDPFLGSGTVLYECARKNLSAMGSELNPSAYYMAKSYELCILSAEERSELIRTIDNKLAFACNANNPLNYLLSIVSNELSPLVKNTLSLIVVLLDLYSNEFSLRLIAEKWSKLKSIIASLPYASNKICALLGNAKKIEVSSNTVDLIITSPPYINVFNYHQKYRRSVETLGYDVLNIAKGEIGSNRKNRGNRFFTVVEYCLDMSVAIEEMIRVARPNARIILVVGRESNVLSTAFSNSELIYKIASDVHNLPLALKQQRVFKNKYGQMIYEDILHFTNNSSNQMYTYEGLLDATRQIAINALREKALTKDIGDKNYPLLLSAISNAKSIKPSEGQQ
jgi:DNA modification methylase